MTKRHDAVFDDVLSGFGDKDQDVGTTPKPSRPAAERREGRFLTRSNALSDRFSGDVVEKTLLWVDPERCRMWDRHNRRYELLNENRCADLIDGFKAQGQQEFPAIVRRITDDPAYDYEVICGARRHWTVSWLRTHNYRQFRFLIEVRELSDEEAFRLGDIENRERTDISDYERACDYADAVRRYYGGRQKDMAARLEVSEAWLSRYLGLAKLPQEIVAAYVDVTEIREHHARELKSLMATNDQRRRLLVEAKVLAEEQSRGRAGEGQVIDGPTVVARLKRAAVERTRKERAPATVYANGRGRTVLTARPGKGRGLILEVVDTRDSDAVLNACRRALEDHGAGRSAKR